MKIHAITVYQPWATLIAIGAKTIETRSWAIDIQRWAIETSGRMGPLAIHAAKAIYKEHPLWFSNKFCMDALLSAGYYDMRTLPRGSVISFAYLQDCVRITPEFTAQLSEQELSFGDFAQGRWAWILKDVRRLPEPIPARGRQGIWRWEVPEGLLNAEHEST